MVEHTPGPWMAGKPNSFTANDSAQALRERGYEWPVYCTEGAGRWIALCKTPEDQDLIAAAPELLQALERAVKEGIELLCICTPPGSGSLACRACVEWIQPAKAAIAKARGES